MPVASCSGASSCGRLISISSVPGGNPAALADPEGFAAAWGLCPACRKYNCDRCISSQGGRCVCGGALRVYTEPERIRVAGDITSGREATVVPMGGGGGSSGGGNYRSPAPAATAAASFGSGGAPSVTTVLEGIAQQVEQELARGAHDRAKSFAGLAGSIVSSRGSELAPAMVDGVMRYGEQFFRWKLYPEGAEYWKAVYQWIDKAGGAGSPKANETVAIVGAFQVMAGILPPSSPTAQKVLEMLQAQFGPNSALVKEVTTKMQSGAFSGSSGAFGGSSGAFGGGAPAAAAPVNMAPTPAAQHQALANLDPSGRLSLWVTLAFIDIAGADGKVGDDEYMVWKRTIAQMQLPDIWDRFGTQGLADLLRSGVLQQLSASFATMPPEARGKMAGVLYSFVMADGKAEQRELDAMGRICSWLGVRMNITP